MYRIIFYLFWLTALLTVYFWPTLSSAFLDSLSTKDLRTGLSGSWVMIPKDRIYPNIPNERTNIIIGGDGDIVTFSKYFLFTEDRFLPRQYSIKPISYRMGGEYYTQPVIFLVPKICRKSIYDGFAILSITPDTLKLFPTFMINLRKKPIIYTFKKINVQ